MAHRHYHPRSFGLLFEAKALLPNANPPASHFIEGTIYAEEGQPGLNASGRVETRHEDPVAHPNQAFDYDSLTHLAALLGLTQEGVNVLTGRITSTINKQ